MSTITSIATRRRDNTWVQRAACAGTAAPDCFYPLPDQAEETEAAKALCAGCPVSEECLTEALETNDRYGIRGGLVESERIVLHRLGKVRWEEERVVAALNGRPVSLSPQEKHSVSVVAAILDLDPRIWAPVLGIGRKRALTRLREARAQLEKQPFLLRREQRIAAAFSPEAAAVAA
ncbi:MULTISPECIES: WhiB family transcriptional regulator [unclassified Kitasatospora]|uniref:WhiB family transcriptional regulator n=1 Tax=unclassified Kitasatospora TaxID=2633591 RepID=UPI000691626F|nr:MULTISPECIES: WhiB family transcriptional regulator [unclassified Kitasatospora]MCG6497035.1 WhiB family transcriptional regulator [Kitasatospora sp. A2-31]